MSEHQLSLLGDAEHDVLKTADISPDGVYRYTLNRIWGSGRGVLPWIMLNPSTADHEVDDPTIRRCIGFARSLGYAGITVTNLYAFRATDPRALLGATDPVGPRNDTILRRTMVAAAGDGLPVIAAWGVNARPERVAELLTWPGADRLHCLGVTRDGYPRHPLYLSKDAALSPWPITDRGL
jgi:hypothetical protein